MKLLRKTVETDNTIIAEIVEISGIEFTVCVRNKFARDVYRVQLQIHVQYFRSIELSKKKAKFVAKRCLPKNCSIFSE